MQQDHPKLSRFAPAFFMRISKNSQNLTPKMGQIGKFLKIFSIYFVTY